VILPRSDTRIRASVRRRARSPDEPRPRHIERVIDQSLHPFDETHRMRQARVMVECSFVHQREWM